MADFKPTKLNLSTINNGKGEYNNGDSVQADTINAVVEGAAWVQALGTNQPNYSGDNNVGTPSVSIETLANGTPRLKFANLKGAKGEKGEKGDTGTGILEYDRKSAFPATGETGKIYIDKSTNLTYRWNGSAYVQVGGGGATSSVNVVQNTGNSTTDVMSQKAVTDNFLPAEVSNAEIDINSHADTYVTGHPWLFFNSCSFDNEIDVSKNLKINEYISILNPDTISYEKIYLPAQTGTVVLRPNDLPTETSLVTVSSTGTHAWKPISELGGGGNALKVTVW